MAQTIMKQCLDGGRYILFGMGMDYNKEDCSLPDTLRIF